MLTDKEQINELLHISLIIDDNNQTKVYLNPKDNIEEVCNKLANKYHLNDDIKKKINCMFKAFVNNAFKERGKVKIVKSNKIADKNINRLYYEGIKNHKIKEELKKKKKEEELQKLIDTHTFSPKINYLSQLYAERKHPKIEDKLMKDGEISKEKIWMKKIKENLLQNQKVKIPKTKGFSPDCHKSRKDEKFIETKEKETLNLFEDSSINNKENSTEKKNKMKPHIDIVDLNMVKQFLISPEIQITPRPLNVSQTTLLTNKSKQTYKNLYIQNKDEKSFIKNSIKNLNGNESFTSNHSDWNFLKKKEQLIQDKSSLHTDNNMCLNNNKFKDKNNSIFYNPKIRDQNTCRNSNIATISNRISSVMKDVGSTNVLMPSITELSYYDDKQKYSKKTDKEEKIKIGIDENNNKIHYSQKNHLNTQNVSYKKTIRDKENTFSYNQLKEDKSILLLTQQDQTLKSMKKSLSKLYLKSKDNKEKSKNIHETLYKNAKTSRINRELYVKEFIKREFSFSPKISIINSKTPRESSKEFINRLVYSNKIMNSKPKLNKSAMNLEHSSDLRFQLMPVHKSVSRNKAGFSSKLKLTNKDGNNDNSTNLLSTTDPYSSHSNRKYLNSSNHEKSLKDQLEKSCEKKRSIEKFYKSNFTLKSNENINKFKLNNLKEIFEVIFNNCDNIDDIYDLDCCEIQENLKNKLIIPCCNKMKERNLDFNFQNFYLISNEIIKNFV